MSADSASFRELVEPHLRAIHLHCYRMLGSYHDAEEATQEVLLRAWRGLSGFEGRAPLRHWLYRIATTTCLKTIERRGRAYLEPYPDHLLDELRDDDSDPASIVQQRDAVALAFITALQLLPATQRAVLVLREVLAWPAQDVADVLGTSVPAVNSALQRARATLASSAAAKPRAALDSHQRRVLDEFMRAWQACDIPALAAVLRDDVTLTMPPQELLIAGRARVAEFFATVPAEGKLDLIQLVETRANGQPALAAYLPDDAGVCRGYGVMVFDIEADGIAVITGFPDASLFPLFGLSLVHPPA